MKINETDRKKQLLNLINKYEILAPLIDEMLYLEEQLDYLRTLPKIVVHPKDPTKQKATVAAKQYKELLQQYVNIIRTLERTTGVDEKDEESPLRQWARSRKELQWKIFKYFINATSKGIKIARKHLVRRIVFTQQIPDIL